MVVCCSPSLPYCSHLTPLPVLCLYIGTSPVWRRLQHFVYASEQVCIRWHRTGAYYPAKLKFSHCSSVKVWGAYCTCVHIIFEFLWYVPAWLQFCLAADWAQLDLFLVQFAELIVYSWPEAVCLSLRVFTSVAQIITSTRRLVILHGDPDTHLRQLPDIPPDIPL